MDQVTYQETLLIVSFLITEFFENLISADELLANVLRIFKTCLLGDNDLCGKLDSSLESPIVLGDNLNNSSLSFFIADFKLLY